MSVQPKAGEMLVGAYLKLVEECELVAYGQHSPIAGDQMELDVVGFQPEGDQRIIACEVATHLGGLGYGTAEQNRERVAKKVRNADAYVERAFPSAASVRYEFWSPVVQPKSAGKLAEVAETFAAETGRELELVVNGTYRERVDELRALAGETQAQHGELAFRFLQILEHLRGAT